MRYAILNSLSLDPMAPLAIRRPNMSPLEQALEGGNMEVWNLLKDHIEMTVELKLEQLYNMITTVYRYREEPHTEFKELLSSLPVESVTLLKLLTNWLSTLDYVNLMNALTCGYPSNGADKNYVYFDLVMSKYAMH